jgi:hypothetical protein
MRKLMLVLSAVILTFSESRSADHSDDGTIGAYMKNQNTPEWKNWITGIGVGFWVANKELIAEKRAPLFCFAGTYEPDPKAVLDAWIAKERASRGMIKPGEYFGDHLRVEVAMLIAYENAFPCTAKRN